MRKPDVKGLGKYHEGLALLFAASAFGAAMPSGWPRTPKRGTLSLARLYAAEAIRKGPL